MPTDRKPISRHLRHRLTGWEELSLEYGEARYHRPGFRDDDARREAWFRHRDWLMARCRRGRRPAAYWDYEAPDLRPDVYEYEKAALWEANLLAPEERSQLEAEWREEFEQAQAPDFWHCLGPNENLTGAAARRAWYQDRGIPRDLVRRWSAARRRRTRTISKLAQPAAADAAASSENIKENDQPPTAPASNDACQGAPDNC